MKKIIGFMMVGLLLFGLAGCASSGEKVESASPAVVEDLAGKNIGTIVWFGITDDVLLKLFSEQYATDFASVKSFDSEASLILALDTGKIDAAWLRDFQANAYAKDASQYATFQNDTDKLVAGSARMAAAKGAPAAKELAKINAAISELKADGTLDQLQKEYVDGFSFGKEFASIDLPVISGAPTYKVSISGSMVPLDYIAADGKPTGYSIALLAKLSEKTGLNFELVTAAFGTDRMELVAKKIDFIFCYTLTDESVKKDQELDFSEPYFFYDGSAFLVKK